MGYFAIGEYDGPLAFICIEVAMGEIGQGLIEMVLELLVSEVVVGRAVVVFTQADIKGCLDNLVSGCAF